MFAIARNRPGVISSVEPCSGDEGTLHLVRIDYKDHGFPASEKLIWEVEPNRKLLEPNDLPRVSDSEPMPSREYDALLRAARWSATTPYILPGKNDEELVPTLFSSPLNGALQVEDYQLYPLMKALQMPRVNLLLADDVGLGKTVEACLIITELILRRRIQRILILTPASLRTQWQQDELWDKFSIRFNVVDKDETHKLRKNFGIDANPWRAHSHIIASYHYLRQDDVLEQFFSASSTQDNSPILPWDLLVVDECHNLAPPRVGEESDLCRMLKSIAPLFEHKLFLSATPHNGHTICYTGLLEMLDPVRFSRSNKMTPATKDRVSQVVVRRLKSEINQHTDPPKFGKRMPPKAIELNTGSDETFLNEAFDTLHACIKQIADQAGTGKKRTSRFVIEIFKKRLLSCPVAFAETWQRATAGLNREEVANDQDVAHAEHQISRSLDDDRETQRNEEIAAEEAGSWLQGLISDIDPELQAELGKAIDSVNKAVKELGLDPADERGAIGRPSPKADAKFAALCELIDNLLREDGEWRQDERLIVFTEYKTTLDYLQARLQELYGEDRVLDLYGGMRQSDREERKHKFNDPQDSVRILVATDAASEGLNLQATARYLLHYDCPWNPSRLEQRNGRLDRHGQARDVSIHHFFSRYRADSEFLSYVIKKAHDIREDLGSANELFDNSLREVLINRQETQHIRQDLDHSIRELNQYGDVEADNLASTDDRGDQALKRIKDELDLDPESLRDTLTAAMGAGSLRCSEDKKVCKIADPKLPGWVETIDESVRLSLPNSTELGPLRSLAFDHIPFIENIGEREIFRPCKNTLLVHLSHPLMQKAISTLARRRYPGSNPQVSRWTVKLSDLPAGVEAQMLFSVEELAVNHLREAFHHWVRTFTFFIRGGKLNDPEEHQAPSCSREGVSTHETSHVDRAKCLVEDLESGIKLFLGEHRLWLTEQFRKRLAEQKISAVQQAKTEYAKRRGEILTLIKNNTPASLKKEIEELKKRADVRLLFAEFEERERIGQRLEELKEEVSRRKRRHEEVWGQLEKERERTIKRLLPKRYEMDGEAYVYPICLEIRLPRMGRQQ